MVIRLFLKHLVLDYVPGVFILLEVPRNISIADWSDRHNRTCSFGVASSFKGISFDGTDDSEDFWRRLGIPVCLRVIEDVEGRTKDFASVGSSRYFMV